MRCQRHRGPASRALAALAFFCLVTASCSALTTTDPVDETTEDGAEIAVGESGAETDQPSGADWPVLGSPVRRIGPGRAVAADAAGSTTLVGTTAGVELRRDGQVTSLPATTLEPPTEIQLSPDGNHGVITRADGVEVWHLGPEPSVIASSPTAVSSALADDGAAILASSQALGLVDPDDGLVEEVAVSAGRSFGVVAAPDDGSWWLATMYGGETVEAMVSMTGMSTDGGQDVVSLELPGEVVVERAVADPSGDRVLLGLLGNFDGLNRQLVQWDLVGGRQWSMPLLTDDSWDVAPDGTVLIVGTSDGRMVAPDGQVAELGSVNDGQPPFAVHALGPDRFVVLLRDGGRIVLDGAGEVVDSIDGTNRSVTSSATRANPAGVGVVYFLGTFETVDESGVGAEFTDRYAAGVVNDVQIGAEDSLAIATSTGTVSILAVGDGSEVEDGSPVAFEHDEGDVQSVAFSPDGSRLLTGVGERFSENRYDDTVTIWDAGRQERLVEIGGEAEEVLGCSSFTNAVRYASDGSFVVGISHDFTVSVFDGETLEPIRTLPPHDGPILGIALSPDDSRLISTSQEGLSMRIWDIGSGELVAEHQAPLGGYRSVDYLPDGSGVLVSELSGQLSIVDPDTGEVLRAFDSLMSVGGRPTISADGRYVAAGEGPVARLWSTETGQVVGELSGHSGFVTSAAFTADGNRLVTGATDGTAVVWDLTGT